MGGFGQVGGGFGGGGFGQTFQQPQITPKQVKLGSRDLSYSLVKDGKSDFKIISVSTDRNKSLSELRMEDYLNRPSNQVARVDPVAAFMSPNTSFGTTPTGGGSFGEDRFSFGGTSGIGSLAGNSFSNQSQASFGSTSFGNTSGGFIQPAHERSSSFGQSPSINFGHNQIPDLGLTHHSPVSNFGFTPVGYGQPASGGFGSSTGFGSQRQAPISGFVGVSQPSGLVLGSSISSLANQQPTGYQHSLVQFQGYTGQPSSRSDVQQQPVFGNFGTNVPASDNRFGLTPQLATIGSVQPAELPAHGPSYSVHAQGVPQQGSQQHGFHQFTDRPQQHQGQGAYSIQQQPSQDGFIPQQPQQHGFGFGSPQRRLF